MPPGDVQALAGQIERLAGDPAHRAELGAAGRETVRRAFTWERCGAQTVRAYADALA